MKLWRSALTRRCKTCGGDLVKSSRQFYCCLKGCNKLIPCREVETGKEIEAEESAKAKAKDR